MTFLMNVFLSDKMQLCLTQDFNESGRYLHFSLFGNDKTIIYLKGRAL
jgi:hypothetical protein